LAAQKHQNFGAIWDNFAISGIVNRKTALQTIVSLEYTRT